MEIKDYLDEDCDTRVVFYNQYEGADGVMEFGNSDDDHLVRIYPEGIYKLQKFIEFAITMIEDK